MARVPMLRRLAAALLAIALAASPAVAQKIIYSPATPPEAVLISTQTAASSAALSWTALGSYRSYHMVCSALVPATNNVNVGIQIGTGGTPTFQTASYRWTYTYATDGAAGGVGGSISDSYIRPVSSITNTASNGGADFEANFSNLASTTQNKSVLFHAVTFNAANYLNAVGAGAYVGDQNAITGLRVLMSSGNIASGQCSLYGRLT